MKRVTTLNQTYPLTPSLTPELMGLDGFQDAMVHLQQLAGVGGLTSSVAHELSNPISIITATCSNFEMQLEDGDIDTAQMNHYLRIIHANAYRCAQIVETLRAYTYRHTKGAIPVAINALVTDALALFLPHLKHQSHIHIATELASDLPTVPGYPEQLTQVLVNLLTNAYDVLIVTGGDITVRSWLCSPTQVALLVHDSGPEVDTAVWSQIFTPFFTTKPKGEGSGLGLPIIAEIVRAHQGFIEAVNTPDQGTTFTVVLPISGQEPVINETK